MHFSCVICILTDSEVDLKKSKKDGSMSFEWVMQKQYKAPLIILEMGYKKNCMESEVMWIECFCDSRVV